MICRFDTIFGSNLKKKKEWCYSVTRKKRHKFTVNTSRRIISVSSNGINHHRSPGLSLKCEEYMGMLSSRLKFSGSKGREPYITLTTRGVDPSRWFTTEKLGPDMDCSGYCQYWAELRPNVRGIYFMLWVL